MSAVTVKDVTDILEGLSNENLISAYDYIRQLAKEQGRRKAERAQRAFDHVKEILDGDTGWTSEEEMIADLAEFRRKRMAGHENTD